MVQKIKAEIVSSSRLTQTIWQYHIKPEHFVRYESGQYLSIHIGSNTWHYSIAEPVSEKSYYELHIRQSSEQARAFDWRIGSLLEVSLPYGTCHTRRLDHQKAILFIAAGMGYVPIRAMVEDLLSRCCSQRIELYWKVSHDEDLYDKNLLDYWIKNSQNFKFFPIVSLNKNQRPTNFILDQHLHDLKNWQVVMAGAFDLMYLQRDFLITQGLDKDSIFSDAFEFEKKNKHELLERLKISEA